MARVAATLVLAGWGRPVCAASPLGGGMNSATALVDLPDQRTVLKWVRDTTAGALAAGCEVARRLARHGLITGEPLPTVAGDLIYPAEVGVVALLRFVDGVPLSPTSPRDQHDLAVTLAAVHAVEATQQSGRFMSDQVAELVHDVEPWVRPTVAGVLDEYGQLPELTWGLLHADPAPEAFLRLPGTDQVALIDWSSTTRGPVLYDVASALMYLGGRRNAAAFWEAYVDHSSASSSELGGYLGALTRFRAAVQAAYFSWRIATVDITGVRDHNENWRGLRDAELMLRANGAEMVNKLP